MNLRKIKAAAKAICKVCGLPIAVGEICLMGNIIGNGLYDHQFHLECFRDGSWDVSDAAGPAGAKP